MFLQPVDEQASAEMSWQPFNTSPEGRKTELASSQQRTVGELTDNRHGERFRLELRKCLSPRKDSEGLNRLPREIVLPPPWERSKM